MQQLKKFRLKNDKVMLLKDNYFFKNLLYIAQFIINSFVLKSYIFL